MGKQKTHTNILMETINGRYNLEDVDVDRMITLKRILQKYIAKLWTELNVIEIRSKGEILWIRPWNFELNKKFPEYVNNYQQLKKVS
jgi:hypothetical protein